MLSFGKLLTAMITPMQADGAVDFDMAAHLARHLAATGSDGIVVSGTTGESPALTNEEKLQLFRVVREAVDSPVTVVAGTGTNSTHDSVEMTRLAESAGVDGIMAVVPYYNKPPQEALFQHFKTIAGSTSLPVMVYNVPGRTSQNLLPHTLARLADSVPNVVAVKEASGNLDQVSEVRRLCHDGVFVYSGDDSLTLPILAVGGYGVVSVAGHLVGDRIRAMIEAFFAGQVHEATRIHLELLPLVKALFVTTNPIPVKVALRLTGMDVGPFRLPLCEPSEDETAQLRRCLQNYGLLA